ncbi:MAG TPA: fused MFS/spermidine synthase [Bacteroidia bacterium]|nr:fused MFS/spermidine synthase [Bacteroidia bacterium]
MKKNSLHFYYLVSFVEGGMMLVSELASSRKLAVFFGSSLYVWLMVLCITMLGLAAGYYYANYLCQKETNTNKQFNSKTLSILFLLLAISLSLWKFNTNISMILIQYNFELLTAVFLDALFLLLIPMFAFGAISTILIDASQKINHHQPTYGKILAFSTMGSIVFAIMAVLFTFPYLGIQMTIYILSFIALLVSVLFYKIEIFLTMLFIVAIIYPEKKLHKNIIYQNDGVFSSVMVVDDYQTRYLLVNYIIQSFVDFKNDKTLDYANVIDSVFSAHKWKNKKILILGLGGGIIANKLSKYSSEITGVEIDPRIIDCAKKYFNLNKNVKTICDDAQWFLKKDTAHYDVIIMDLFNGEEPPSYLLTAENFSELKTHFKNDSSVLIINWYGYYKNKTGKGTRVLVSTLQKSGFFTSHISTGVSEATSNLILFASNNENILPENKIDISLEKEINSSDKNTLALLNASANYEWRKGYLNFIRYWWGR